MHSIARFSEEMFFVHFNRLLLYMYILSKNGTRKRKQNICFKNKDTEFQYDNYT